MKFFLPAFIASMVTMFSGNADALNVRVPGINYVPRKGLDWVPENERCKSPSEIQKDLRTLKSITDKIRIYSLIDCNQAEAVLPAAKSVGLQVELGTWTMTSKPETLQKEKAKLASLIDAGLYGDNVSGFFVAIYDDFVVDTAVSYVNEIRDYLRSRGIRTPVSLADVSSVFTNYPQLIDAVDYISITSVPFNDAVNVNEAAATALDDMKDVRILAAEKGKKVIVSETTWASGGSHPSLGVASPANQAKYFSDYFQMARARNLDFYWYFAFDTTFREEIMNTCGLFSTNGTLKSQFKELTIGLKTPRAIRNVGSKRLLSESGGNVSTTNKSSDWFVKEQQVWFFDSATQQLRSKSSDRCLDAYQGWNGGIVHMYRCMDNEANQKWTFDSSTGKFKHAKHHGFCLDTDPAQNNKVQLYGCSPNNPNQQWSVIDPAKI
ncbi:unnamed protein product [Phytophthora fragariaefolia]|uniref:glucan endo-1,3-beta-D-glucosidase n=1 Tax=Phytophthora fragariaefolia TaxID=1490495 RepID=A0A9W6UBF1_9STRA|nr:unnamed protein product [Phytophthora fragariaefolia]